MTDTECDAEYIRLRPGEPLQAGDERMEWTPRRLGRKRYPLGWLPVDFIGPVPRTGMFRRPTEPSAKENPCHTS